MGVISIGIGALVVMLLLMFLGIPVPFTIGLVTVVATFLVWSGNPIAGLAGLTAQALSQTSSFLLTAVPLFLLMGELLLESEINKDVFEAFSAWLGWIRGGLAVATVVMAALFAAVIGSSAANAALLGRVALPEMKRKGYSDNLSSGSIAAGGTLGILIPPSIAMIFYALFAEESVLKLFMSGVFPGMFLAALFCIWVLIHVKTKPMVAPAREPFVLATALKTTVKLVPLIILIIFMWYSFYFGVATPTETAAVGVFVAFVLGFAYKRLNLAKVQRALVNTAKVTAMLMWIFVPALALGQVLAYTGVLTTLTNAVTDANLSPGALLLIMFFLLFVLGCIIDTSTILMVVLPILIELARAVGIDLVWFCVFFVINNELALITPPFAVNLFVLKGIAPELKTHDLYSGVLPYVVIMSISLVVLFFFPQIALWLPNSM